MTLYDKTVNDISFAHHAVTINILNNGTFV